MESRAEPLKTNDTAKRLYDNSGRRGIYTFYNRNHVHRSITICVYKLDTDPEDHPLIDIHTRVTQGLPAILLKEC